MDRQQPRIAWGAFQQLRRLVARQAFTLIELLVVIVVIGILIALATPSFLGQQEKAQDSSAKQRVASASRAAKAIWASEGQAYPADFVAQLAASEPQYNITDGTGFSPNAVTARRVSADTINVQTESASGKRYVVQQSGPRELRGSQTPSAASVTNMFTNPSFENDNNGWTVVDDGGVTYTAQGVRSTTWARVGRYSNQVDVSCSANGGAGRNVYLSTPQLMTVTPEQMYTFRGSVNIVESTPWNQATNTGAQWVHPFIFWYNAAGVPLGGSWGGAWWDAAGAVGNGQRDITWTETAPAGATRVWTGFYVWCDSGSIEFYADAAVFAQTGSDPGYLDGTLPAVSWNGAAHASTSTGRGWKPF